MKGLEERVKEREERVKGDAPGAENTVLCPIFAQYDVYNWLDHRDSYIPYGDVTVQRARRRYFTKLFSERDCLKGPFEKHRTKNIPIRHLEDVVELP